MVVYVLLSMDLLRAFDYGSSASDIGISGVLGTSYLDATGIGALPGGLGGCATGVPWRRPLAGNDGYVSCPQCHKPITSYNLNRHVRMVHSNMEHATCTVCGKDFKNKYSLATHMHRQHSDNSPASAPPLHPPPPLPHLPSLTPRTCESFPSVSNKSNA
ncbi:hypothetical protein SK128_025437 [Halocaridina rubra]|uniref:C2H2-type domain-containing protein n=1 Tax=Halocaridina rubra TaxID=373956 RepID=A0AAN8XMH9_HALRR